MLKNILRTKLFGVCWNTSTCDILFGGIRPSCIPGNVNQFIKRTASTFALDNGILAFVSQPIHYFYMPKDALVLNGHTTGNLIIVTIQILVLPVYQIFQNIFLDRLFQYYLNLNLFLSRWIVLQVASFSNYSDDVTMSWYLKQIFHISVNDCMTCLNSFLFKYICFSLKVFLKFILYGHKFSANRYIFL